MALKAVALTCARCGGRLLVAPGVGVGVCNPCSTAYDFSGGEKRAFPVEEPVPSSEETDEGGAAECRLPFLRFEAAGAGSSAEVFVMAFALSKIGTAQDAGSKLTVDGLVVKVRPGRVDVPPELSVATAAALARFLALRRLDPGGERGLRPAAVRLGTPVLFSIPCADRGTSLLEPYTRLTLPRPNVPLAAERTSS
jgi:hypothetical protein